jgi:hypothetical protein
VIAVHRDLRRPMRPGRRRPGVPSLPHPETRRRLPAASGAGRSSRQPHPVAPPAPRGGGCRSHPAVLGRRIRAGGRPGPPLVPPASGMTFRLTAGRAGSRPPGQSEWAWCSRPRSTGLCSPANAAFAQRSGPADTASRQRTIATKRLLTARCSRARRRAPLPGVHRSADVDASSTDRPATVGQPVQVRARSSIAPRPSSRALRRDLAAFACRSIPRHGSAGGVDPPRQGHMATPPPTGESPASSVGRPRAGGGAGGGRQPDAILVPAIGWLARMAG